MLQRYTTFIVLILIFNGLQVTAQNMVHVSDALGSDGATCGGVGSPCKTIQYAVDNIALDDDTVKIDTGLYSLATTVAAQTPVVQLPQGKSLAFVGTASGLGSRINGDQIRRGFLYYYSGTNCTSGSGNDGLADSLSFYFSDLIVENCNITEMCGTTSYAYGGGIRLDCDSASTLKATITDCIFRENRAYDNPGTFAGGRSASGGAIYIFGRRLATANPALYAEAHISNCDFSGNYADQNYNGGHGGAILLRDLDTASVSNSSFCDNYVYSQTADNGDLQHDRNAGGAICVYDLWNGSPGHGYTIDNCSFINNSATTNGGANYTFQSEGGAIFLTKGDNLNGQNSATVYISNSAFYNNYIETGIEHIDNNGGTIDTTAIGFNNYYDQFQVDLGSDTSLCEGDSLVLDASIPGATYLWQDGSTGPFYTVLGSGQYEVTVTVGSCETYDTIDVDVVPFPSVDLGPDTTLCPYDSVLLDVYQANASYLWSTGSTDSAIHVSNAGWVWVEVSVEGCASRDSMHADTVSISNQVLGNDTTVCPDVEFTLDAYTEGATYLWQDASSNATFNVSQGGQYRVTVDKSGCTIEDTIVVVYVEEVTDIIGDDTIACDAGTVYRTVRPSGLEGILWSDNSTDSVRAITTPGVYSVTINDRGCYFSDEITVSFKALPEVDLGPDTGGCSGTFVVLDAFVPQATYKWNDGSTNPYYTAGKSGVYSVTVTYDGCDASDAAVLTFDQTPNVELPEVIDLCEGSSYILKPREVVGQYEWSNGETSATIKIESPGVYALTVSNNGCEDADSTAVHYYPYPEIELGDDTTICEESKIELHAGGDSASVLWQDGSRNHLYTVEKGGKYWVQVTENGCTSSDTIRYKQRYLPRLNLGNDTTICEGDTFTYHLEDEHTMYLWNGSNHSNHFFVQDSGMIMVRGENGCGKTDDSVRVTTMDCHCNFYTPNAFTPHLDRKNDVYSVSYDCDITDFEIMIFDRWGKEVYHSDDPDFTWDGTSKGQPVQIGAYAYVIVYWARMDLKPKPVRFERHGVIHLLK